MVPSKHINNNSQQPVTIQLENKAHKPSGQVDSNQNPKAQLASDFIKQIIGQNRSNNTSVLGNASKQHAKNLHQNLHDSRQ